MNLRYLFFNDGILYWGSIFGGVTLLTVITIILKLLKIARINPAEVIKNESKYNSKTIQL